MKYTLSNKLIQGSWFENVIHSTLDLYEDDKDTSNSPLIEFQRNWKNGGGMHADCGGISEDKYEACIQKRQLSFFALYESIKTTGYNGSEMLCFFNGVGELHVYDGHHRLSIMNYLGIEEDVNIETEWVGMNAGRYSPKESHDFPLKKYLTLPSGRVRVYQPIDDERVSDIRIERPDSAARLEFILNHISGETILDIGCSEGYFSRPLLEKGYDVLSVDIDKNYLYAARYLTTTANLKGNFICKSWEDVINGREFDNVLYLSVLHNEINAVGEVQAFENLKLMRGRVKQLFIEVPSVEVQPDWAHIFKPDEIIPRLEKALGMELKETYDGWRPLHLFVQSDGEPQREREQIIENVLGKYKLKFPYNDRYATDKLRRDGVYELNTTEFIKSTLKPGQVFVDVGANMGYFSVLASDLVGGDGKVFSFEPDKKNCELLIENINENGCKNVNVLELGLSNKAGDVTLFKSSDPGCHGIIKGEIQNPIGEETIHVERGDDVLDGIPNVIKVDVGGAERLVFEGMANILSTDKPITIIFEDWGGKANVAGWLKENYGFQEVMHSHADGTFAMVNNQEVVRHKERLITHLVGNCDIPTVRGGIDAFGTKVCYMGRMLQEMGHKVYFYGVQGSEVPCDEFIKVLPKKIIRDAYGDDWETKRPMKRHDRIHRLFEDVAAKEINARKGKCALLLLSGGLNHKRIYDQTKVPLTAEIGIGYIGSFAPYRIFESNAWRHWSYGKEGLDNGKFMDAVIPASFDPSDFEYSEDKDDYYLYMGRVIHRKGVKIAIDTVEAIGGKLKIAGSLSEDVDISSPCVEYLGVVVGEEKKKLLSKAKAVFVPTIYIEPFGVVIAEAGLSGTPVITTDFGSFYELVQHGVTGYRCRSLDHFMWAARHVSDIRSSDCLKYSLENFTLDVARQKYEEYFSQLLDLFGNGWYNINNERTDIPNI